MPWSHFQLSQTLDSVSDQEQTKMASRVASVLESLPNVQRLSSRVVRVLGLNPGLMTLQGTNTYLVGTGKRRILVDTGEDEKPAYIQLLGHTLRELNVTVGHIVITHWHQDHIGGLKDVMELTRDSRPTVSKYPLLEKDKQWINPATLTVSPLSDGDVIRTEGATLRVLHTPGHTEDHVALLLEEEKAVFSADCILGQGTAVFENLYDYLHSLERLLELRPTQLYPGHGPVVEDGTAWISHYLQHRAKREQQIISHLKHAGSPQSPKQIVEAIYKDVSDKLWPAAEVNVKHHLDKLRREGRAVLLEGDQEGRWVMKTISDL